MTYELAKQLKDAGFPQSGDHYCTHQGCDSDVCYPTLEEFIEACNCESFSLFHRSSKAQWMATNLSTQRGVPSIDGVGDTPTEAVARLWLALQKP